jgi:hypothetical protein
MRYLRRVWIDPTSEDNLRSSAVALYAARPSELASTVLSWGMAIAAYPFLNQVAAIVGRMLRIQPEVKLEQILRKLSETYGERETVRRSGRYALGLITDLGFIKHADTAGCYILGSKIKTDNAGLCGWFVRAWFASTGSPLVIDRTTLIGTPSLAFFNAGSLVAGAINSGTLIPERLSLSQEMLRLQKQESHGLLPNQQQ